MSSLNPDTDAGKKINDVTHQLDSQKTYTIAQLKDVKPIPLPHTVSNQRMPSGSVLTFANVSGRRETVCWAKGVYESGELITTNLQGMARLKNGQVCYHKTSGCYAFQINYTDSKNADKFDECSPMVYVTTFYAFEVQMINGVLSITEGTVAAQQQGVLYWNVHDNNKSLTDWSIEVFFNAELLITLKPDKQGIVYVDADNANIQPEASFKTEEYYTVYLLKQNQPVLDAVYSAKQRKSLVEIGPKLIRPGQIFALCGGSSGASGAASRQVQVVVLNISEVTSAQEYAIPLASDQGSPF